MSHMHIYILMYNNYNSEEEEKGSDCIDQFRNMQECFFKYPEEYGKFTEEEEVEGRAGEGQSEQVSPPVSPAGDDTSKNDPDSKSDSGLEQTKVELKPELAM